MQTLNTFLLEQYRDQAAEEVIAVQENDVVIDGGACWGDTALYFGNRVGEAGKVFSFEFDPANIAIFEKNLTLNPSLSNCVEICPFALWDKSGQEINCSSNYGTSSALDIGTGSSKTAQTLTIDDFCAEKNLIVDFIKLDIEGAELRALIGAEHTIRKCKPKLAICLYHKIQDFLEIPEFLEKLDIGYRFYIGHVPSNYEETVLFATTQPS